MFISSSKGAIYWNLIVSPELIVSDDGWKEPDCVNCIVYVCGCLGIDEGDGKGVAVGVDVKFGETEGVMAGVITGVGAGVEPRLPTKYVAKRLFAF